MLDSCACQTIKRVATVIVNYGTSNLVLAALPALLRELSPFSDTYIVIVDNNSPDGDGLRLKTGVEALGVGPSVEIVLSEVNGGFAAGVNLGFASIRRLEWVVDAVLLLNPDAELRPGALREMVRVMQDHPRAGFVGPRLRNPDGSTWTAAFHFPSLIREVAGNLGLGVLQRLYPIVASASDTPVRVDWVTGTAALIRGEAFRALGDMDDGYFLYYEEVDYMLQGRRLGWESWHAPAALVAHEAGASTRVKDGRVRSGRQPDYMFRSWARYFAKNHGAVYARVVAIATLLALAFGTLQRRLRGKAEQKPENFLADFATKVAFGRLSPPPCSALAATPGGTPPITTARIMR